jgi:hypothetical protein
MYNAGVHLGDGFSSYTRHACMHSFLTSSGTTDNYTAPCFSGTNWLYSYANKCDSMSSDMRLSLRTGAEEDKCSSLVAQQYVEVDDLWGFMASERHDPCGWPFVECVSDCSLPSNPASRSWWINPADDMVYDSVNGNLIRCMGSNCPAGDAGSMKNPRSANQIAAM